MPTNRKRTARKMIIHAEPLSDALEHYFLCGNLGGDLRGKVDAFRLLKHEDKLKIIWLKYRQQILAKNKNAWAEENFGGIV